MVPDRSGEMNQEPTNGENNQKHYRRLPEDDDCQFPFLECVLKLKNIQCFAELQAIGFLALVIINDHASVVL